MALIVQQKLNTGVTVAYFRISRIVVDRKSKAVQLSVEAYLDQDNRLNGSAPVTEYQYEAQDLYNSLDKLPAFTSSYNFLKTQDLFEGAEDA